ncbi:hypothetical protein EDB89DRAFT_182992 [Lactarius sanguifluus]|nr:hypothetical protein EDB89DRAFT_182992 [Lactarius sanguifluus]
MHDVAAMQVVQPICPVFKLSARYSANCPRPIQLRSCSKKKRRVHRLNTNLPCKVDHLQNALVPSPPPSQRRDMLPSVASRTIRSLALASACSPDATPRLTVLSNCDRRGLAPKLVVRVLPPPPARTRAIHLAFELPSRKKRRRKLTLPDVVKLAPRSLDVARSTGSNEGDCDCDGVLNGLDEGAPPYSPDTARGNGMGTSESPSPPTVAVIWTAP